MVNFTKVLQEKYLAQDLWFFSILSHIHHKNSKLLQHEPLCPIHDFTITPFFLEILPWCCYLCSSFPPLPYSPGRDFYFFWNYLF